MSRENLRLGVLGEAEAVGLLQESGYKIIARNYKSRMGEIDIIAFCGEIICFIEVKTRRNDKFGLPQEAVSFSKQRHIGRVALLYLKENKLLDKKARFDVVSVVYSEGRPQASLIQNAFQLEERYTY